MIPDRRFKATRGTRRTLPLTALVAVGLSAVALASTGTTRLSGAANAGLGKTIVTAPSGRTLYALSAETTHHLLCKGACLRTWPPLTVPSRSTKVTLGGGVHGTVGLLRRSNGSLQVTLRGKPLYRFSGDHSKGDAKGEGIEADGGTWHAFTAAATPTPPPTNTPVPPYEY